MKVILSAALALAISSPAIGQDAVAKQAISCWNPPMTTIDSLSDARVSFDVLLGADGRVQDIAVVDYVPQNDIGKEIVLSASRAIEMCDPYDKGAAGVRRVEMSWPRQDVIDPFGPLKAN